MEPKTWYFLVVTQEPETLSVHRLQACLHFEDGQGFRKRLGRALSEWRESESGKRSHADWSRNGVFDLDSLYGALHDDEALSDLTPVLLRHGIENLSVDVWAASGPENDWSDRDDLLADQQAGAADLDEPGLHEPADDQPKDVKSVIQKLEAAGRKASEELKVLLADAPPEAVKAVEERWKELLKPWPFPPNMPLRCV